MNDTPSISDLMLQIPGDSAPQLSAPPLSLNGPTQADLLFQLPAYKPLAVPGVSSPSGGIATESIDNASPQPSRTVDQILASRPVVTPPANQTTDEVAKLRAASADDDQQADQTTAAAYANPLPKPAPMSFGTKDLAAGIPLLLASMHNSPWQSEEMSRFADGYLEGKQRLLDQQNQYNQAAFEQAMEGNLARAESLRRTADRSRDMADALGERASQDHANAGQDIGLLDLNDSHRAAVARLAAQDPDVDVMLRSLSGADQEGKQKVYGWLKGQFPELFGGMSNLAIDSLQPLKQASLSPRERFSTPSAMSDADQATKLADASLKAAESKLSKLNPTGFGGLKAMEALPAFLDKTKDIESARRDATSAVASLEREYNVIKTVGDHAWANSDKSKQNPEQTRADVQAALQENALKRSAYIQRIQGMDNKLDNLRTAMGLPRMRDLVNGMHGILQSATHNAMIDPKSQGMARDNIRQAAERFSHQTGGRSIWQYLPKPTWAE